MKHTTQLFLDEIEVKADPTAVWNLLQSPSQWMKWDHTLNSIDTDAKNDKLEVGNFIRLNLKQGPRMKFVVNEISPTLHLHLIAPFGWLKVHVEYSIKEKKGESVFTVNITSRGLLHQLLSIMRSTFEKNTTLEMKKIKELAEK